jgi:hypothetical protein
VNTPAPGHRLPPTGTVLRLPPLVRRFIEDRYLAGTADAEAQYLNAAGDEDSLTGALGALVSTSGPVGFSGDATGEIVVQISYRKVRGRGPHAPEKRFGTDGIFQLQVTQQGQTIFRKGLPFQAKKNWKGRDRHLAAQAQDMKRRVGGGIVIDYTAKGYTACAIEPVIDAGGSRKRVADAGQIGALGQVLAHRFLDCEVGIQGLYYDDQNEAFMNLWSEADMNIIDTSVTLMERREDPVHEQG